MRGKHNEPHKSPEIGVSANELFIKEKFTFDPKIS